MKLMKSICLVAVCLYAASAGAQPAGYFETLDLDNAWANRGHSKSAVSHIDLSAFSLSMKAELQLNAELINSAPIQVSKSVTESDALILKGILTNTRDSWVRLSRVSGLWSGAVWDGHELYLIENAQALRSSGFDGVPPGASTVIFRQSEVRWPTVKDLVLNPDNLAADTQPAPLDLSQFDLMDTLGAKGSTPGSSLQLSMTIVADTEFISLNAANPGAAVLARINVVDGVYASQTGVSIRVGHLELLTENGTLTATDSSDLLSAFSSYMRSSNLPQPGLAHLFSGKNFDSNIVGVAYLGVLCSSSYGFGINEFRGSGSSGAMILAHEMGHNFGAPHDGSGACSDEAFRGIMNPSINGSDQFSGCSISQMSDDIDRASCLEVIDFVYGDGFE